MLRRALPPWGATAPVRCSRPGAAVVLSRCVWVSNQGEGHGLRGTVTGAPGQGGRSHSPGALGVRRALALRLPPLEAQSCPDATVQTGSNCILTC